MTKKLCKKEDLFFLEAAGVFQLPDRTAPAYLAEPYSLAPAVKLMCEYQHIYFQVVMLKQRAAKPWLVYIYQLK